MAGKRALLSALLGHELVSREYWALSRIRGPHLLNRRSSRLGKQIGRRRLTVIISQTPGDKQCKSARRVATEVDRGGMATALSSHVPTACPPKAVGMARKLNHGGLIHALQLFLAFNRLRRRFSRGVYRRGTAARSRTIRPCERRCLSFRSDGLWAGLECSGRGIARSAAGRGTSAGGALRMAQSSLDKINHDIKDYTCTMIKRERINGQLNEPEYMFVKIRHQPFSVYLYFLRPDRAKGREVIYVEGRNEGKMLAHEGSGLKSRFGTVSLVPTSALAMDGNKYPITQIGTKNLVKRLLEVGNQDIKYAECEVQYRKNAKVNDRVCTIIEVTHPVPRRNFLFHKALIYVDDELNVPIRYEAYMWPKTPGGALSWMRSTPTST